MCGRYARFTPLETYANLFRARGDIAPSPSYNLAPSDAVLAARASDTGVRELVMLRWGLIPFWAKEAKTGYSTINARAETVATKPAFRSAFRQRRCLIAADGFYEWRGARGSKQPYFIRLKGGLPFALAGLWERWRGDGKVVESCAIIVTNANELVQDIHERMPVILSPESYDVWLDPSLGDRGRLQDLLKPYPANLMEAYPVGLAVNNPRNEGTELLERAHA
jgi:putative SOS response-associated peptidase YedK